jgi:cyclophilin family peptidyl-prolyl cis-trans isomerase
MDQNLAGWVEILKELAKRTLGRNARRRSHWRTWGPAGEHSTWAAAVERLETRFLLNATLNSIGAQQIEAGKFLYVPLTATSSTSSPVNFLVQSSNSNVTATVLAGNPSLKMTVSGTDSSSQPFSGVLTFQMFQDLVPATVARIEQLVNSGFYNGLTFHRIINNFVAQGGDPSGNGTGGSGTLINDEFTSKLTYNSRGLLGLANRGHDTNDSQFFITDTKTSAPLPETLNFQQPIIGILTSGFATFQKLITTPTNTTTNAPLNTATMSNVQIFTDTQNGVLQITAPSGFTGSSNLAVTATDGTGPSSPQNFTTSVVANTTTDRPFLGAVTNQATNENTPISFDVQGIDLENNPLTFVVKALSGFDSTATGADPNGTGSDPQNVMPSITVTPASGSTPAMAHITLTPAHNFTGAISLVVGVRDQTNRSTTGGSLDSLSNFDTQKFTLTVNAQTASKLVFTQTPPTATTGVAVSPVVKVAVEEQSGNVVTGDNSTVTLTLSSGTFAGGSSTATAQAVNGVATFNNLVFNTPGSATLTASDGTLTPATSSSIAVSLPPAPVAPAFTPGTGTSLSADGTTLFVVGGSEHSRIIVRETARRFIIRMLGGVHQVTRMPIGHINNVQIIPGGDDTVIVRRSVETAATIELTTSSQDRIRNRSSSTEVITLPTKLVFTAQPTAGTAGAALSPALQVTLEDKNGKVVTGIPTTVTLTLSSGTFAGGGNTATAQTVNGVATFSNLVINVAGSYTLSASGGSATGATSAAITISAAAASKLAFQQQPPATATAGAALSPAATVAVQDQFGNVVTNDNSTVAMAPSSGSFASGSTTSVQAQSGIATFSNLILNTAGNFTLTASDGSLISATSNSVNVGPAAASKLVFTATPATGSIGHALSPPVLVSEEDQFNNVITGDSSSTVSIAPKTGSFASGSTTTAMLASGVASFNNLIFNAAGTFMLIASESSLPNGNGTSNNITIS